MCTNHAFSPSLRVVIQAIDHGTVAVHQHRPPLIVFHVRLYPDTEQEHDAPVPAIFQAGFKLGASSHEERWRWNEEDKVHPHLLVVAPERPAVDKLNAEEVLVPNIKTAENMNLGPFMTTSAALNARSLLHAPHQPPDMMLVKLVMPSVWWRQS